MARRSACAWVLITSLTAALAGCEEAEGEDTLPDGEAIIPGAADSEGPSAYYASAATTAPLLYSYFETSRDRERSASSLRTTFGRSIQPTSTSGDPWQYLRRSSAMGYFGPIGPYGPLGILGPLGDNIWNSEHYVSGQFAWADWSATLTSLGGPLSAGGPLGHLGPLNPELQPAHDAVEAFASHLRPGGVFAVLGPIGVLGALGPLGPLGPIGAHGYSRNSDGEYTPGSGGTCHDAPAGFEAAPCRRIQVPWEDGGNVRTYQLVERYPEEYAAAMSDNDTSFVVDGAIDHSETDQFAFVSDEPQWVTILVMPVYARYPYVQAISILGQAVANGGQFPGTVAIPHAVSGFPIYNTYDHATTFDDFDIAVDVRSPSVTGTVTSATLGHVDWIQVLVPAGSDMHVRVSLASTWTARAEDFYWGLVGRTVDPEYRLIVVGSTEYGQGRRVFSGPYLRALGGS